MAVRFIPLKPVDPALRIFFPDNFDSIFEDNPTEIYRVVLSASSANSPEKLKTKDASRDEERDRGEDGGSDFVEYDIEGGRYGDGDKSIFVCQLNETLKADEHLFLALQVHIFLQSDNPARTNNNPSPVVGSDFSCGESHVLLQHFYARILDQFPKQMFVTSTQAVPIGIKVSLLLKSSPQQYLNNVASDIYGTHY